MVGNLAVCKVGYGFLREEKAIQGWQAKLRTALFIAEFLHHQPQSVEKISVTCANTLFGQSTQTRGRIVRRVAFASNKISIWVKEDVAVFCDEQYQQPVDKTQYLAVVVLCV